MAVKEYPILFSAPMIKAILAGASARAALGLTRPGYG